MAYLRGTQPFQHVWT